MTTLATEPRVRLSPGQLRVLVLLGLSVFINYVDRGNLSIAAPMLKDDLGLSPAQLGLLLSSFFWTYALFQPVAGWLVDRFNAGWILAGGFFLWSAATATTGLVHGFVTLLMIRLVLGMGESVAYPSYSKILQRQFPEQQRGRANSVIGASAASGPAFGTFVGVILMARFGWRPFFVGLGVVSMLWLLPWLKWKPKPVAVKTNPGKQNEADVYIPTMGEILSLRSAWGTFLGLFCSNYVLYFLITWLPFYLVRERHFSMQQMAQTGGVAFLVMACFTLISGWASDRWLASGASPSRVRKSMIGGGLIGGGLSVILCVSASPTYAVALLMTGSAFLGLGLSSTWAISQTLAGAGAAGRWAGCKNFVGNLGGVVAPWLTGIIVGRTGQFFWAFLITGAVGILGSIFWIFMVGPIRPVVWPAALRRRAAVEPTRFSVST